MALALVIMKDCLGLVYVNTKLFIRRNFVLTLVLVNVPIVCYIYYKLNLVNYAWYNRSHRSTLHCRTPTEDMKDLMELSRDLHFILDELNVTHWLAYGSLWGAIRYKNPLPWDNDVDLGVLRSDIKLLSKNKLRDELANKRITVRYHSWGGFYRVTRRKARADLMVFHNFSNSGYMERVGLEAYLFFINYKKMHAFPTYLVQIPLPKMIFAGVAMPVPHGGLEMQKYQYPYDWWKESKPIGC